MGNSPSSTGKRSKKSSRSSSKDASVAARAQKVAADLQAGFQSGMKKLEENDHPAAQLIDSVCGPYLDTHSLPRRRGGSYDYSSEEESDGDSRGNSEDETTTTDPKNRKRAKNRYDSETVESASYLSQSDYESTAAGNKAGGDRGGRRSKSTTDESSYDTEEDGALQPATSTANKGLQKPLASAFAKRCYFTKAGIGPSTQHYEGLTLTGNVVLMLAAAMKLKGCPTICDEDLRRVEQTYPNQFSRLPDELLLSSGWRRISKYCHFSSKPIPDGVPFFHSKQRMHPSGGYYFLLAAAVGMVRPSDVEPLNRDTLVLLETDFPQACDAAPAILIQDPAEWTLVDRFCFFSGGPINTDEDVYYQADFDGNPIFMLAFLSPSLTPEELYKLDAPPGNGLKTILAVDEVEDIYDLTDRDFDDLKLYHLGPCRALPPYILQPQAWKKVLPPHFLKAKETALMRASEFDPQHSRPNRASAPSPIMNHPQQAIPFNSHTGGVNQAMTPNPHQPLSHDLHHQSLPHQNLPPQMQQMQQPQLQQPQMQQPQLQQPQMQQPQLQQAQYMANPPTYSEEQMVPNDPGFYNPDMMYGRNPMHPEPAPQMRYSATPPPQMQQPYMVQHSPQPMQSQDPYMVVGPGQHQQFHQGSPMLQPQQPHPNSMPPPMPAPMHPQMQVMHPVMQPTEPDPEDQRIEVHRQLEEEGAFVDPSLPMDEAIAIHAQRTLSNRLDPPDDEPPSLKKTEASPTSSPMRQGYGSHPEQYYQLPEGFVGMPSLQHLNVRDEPADSSEMYHFTSPSPEKRVSPININTNTNMKSTITNNFDSPGSSNDSHSDLGLTRAQTPPSTAGVDDYSLRESPRSNLPPTSPDSEFSNAKSTTSAMKGAQELLRRNRQRRLQDATRRRYHDAVEDEEESKDKLGDFPSPKSPESESGATWESGSEVTSVVSGSSVWTDNTNPDRSSRRALILQMAKARMRNNQVKGSASMDESTPEMEDEKKFDVSAGNDDIDLTEELD